MGYKMATRCKMGYGFSKFSRGWIWHALCSLCTLFSGVTEMSYTFVLLYKEQGHHTRTRELMQ